MSSSRAPSRAAYRFSFLCAAYALAGCDPSESDVTHEETPRAQQLDAATPARAADAGATAKGGEASTDQLLTGMRPEFFDWFWNNLNSERFAAWHASHQSFAWKSPPKVPGDLGAEVGASYEAKLTLAGAPHTLTVTYVDPAASVNGVTLESAMAADVTIDGAGPFRLVVEYAQEGEDVRVKQRLALPPGADVAGVQSYLQERMSKLAGFVREQFQKQYVDVELTGRGKIEPIVKGDNLDLVVTQEIGKLTPDMVDWWWDNMGETERYRHWHPTAHQKFTWTTPPKNPRDLFFDPGAMQQVVEVIDADNPTTLNIGWLDPKTVQIPVTYKNYLYGSTNVDGTPLGGFLLHEYEARPNGIIMKSTFRMPALTPPAFAQALGRHCIQEMQFLQYYLPRLFAREYRPNGSGK